MYANDMTEQLEDSVIGCVLMRADNLALLPNVATSDFRNLKARATWEAIRNLEAANTPIDVNSIGTELARAGKLDAVGWDYLGQAAMRVPTVDNAIAYALQLKDLAVRQRLVESISEVLQDAKNGASGAELLSSVMAACNVLDQERPSEAKTIGDLMGERFKQLELIANERAQGIRTMTGYPTGIATLDEKIGGWQPGIVSIVAARPGMGKSSLGLATADACSAAKVGVHLFSLEDTESAYADRALARKSGVAAESMRNSDLRREDLEGLTKARMQAHYQSNWLVDSRSGVTAIEIVRAARRRMRDNGTKVVIVDYVQMVAKERSASTHEALTETVTTFANAAKQDGVAYVVMSQLNRELEKRTDRRPQLSDLRESGSLEERAKCVVALYRGSVYGKPVKGIDYRDGDREPTESEHQATAHVLVLKNSNGRTGVVRAHWHGPTTRIE